jgi:hypothetical protein
MQEFINKVNRLWATVMKYDPDQQKFTITSDDSYSTYDIHLIGKTITQLNLDWDDSGKLGVLYLKCKTLPALAKHKFTLDEFFQDPTCVDDPIQLYKLLQSDDMTAIEADVANYFDKILNTLSRVTKIGTPSDKDTINRITEVVSDVVGSLSRLKVDCLCKGNDISPDLKLATNILVFNTLTECLPIIEQQLDGIYICYISQNNTSDGYFSIFFKSNDSILSVNDRVEEKYFSQHNNSRNGRWQESKAASLFPYDELVKFTDRDYLGYATKYEVEKNVVPISELPEQWILPLVVAVGLMLRKYSSKSVDEVPFRYVAELSSIRRAALIASDEKLPMILNNSLVAKQQSSWVPQVTDRDVRLGTLGHTFNHVSGHYQFDSGVFSESDELWVSTLGAGFEIDWTKIFVPETDTVAEFVGSEQLMQMEVYRQARQQLADYITSRMQKDFTDFGEMLGCARWFKKIILYSKDKIIDDAVRHYKAIMVDKTERNTTISTWGYHIGRQLLISVYEGYEPNAPYRGVILNDLIGLYQSELSNMRKCPVTGCNANVWITFIPCDSTVIENYFNITVPSYVKPWPLANRDKGNSLLDSVDPIFLIESPLEHKIFRFHWSVGFSKRGLNKLLKELAQK